MQYRNTYSKYCTNCLSCIHGEGTFWLGTNGRKQTRDRSRGVFLMASLRGCGPILLSESGNLWLMQLANLPVELLVKVFDGLDVFTLVLCKFVIHIFLLVHRNYTLIPPQKVNRSFNDVIKSSSLLQHKVELALAGVEKNPTCTLGLSECLEAVRSYRRDWENLAWSSAAGWREAIGNISHNRGTFILGEVITRDDDDPHFKLRTQRHQPKSKHRRLEERTWSEDRQAITFGGTDPSQDLLLAILDEGYRRCCPSRVVSLVANVGTL